MGEMNSGRSLSSLLEEDREQVTGAMKADRSAENASKVLEKETDRLMMRYAQSESSGKKLEAAQQMLQTVKCSVPLVQSVSDLEVWQRSVPASSAGKKGTAAGTVFSLVGAGMTVIPALMHPSGILVTVAGAVCLLIGGIFFGRAGARKRAENSSLPAGISGADRESAGKHGRSSGKPQTGSGSSEMTDTQTHFLVDPDAAYHVMKSIVLTADRSLENLSEPSAGAAEEGVSGRTGAGQQGKIAAPGSFSVSSSDLDFFGELLENAYARRRAEMDDPALQEQIESIRFYLHRKGIETEDYSGPADEKWFEFIPSGGGAATIRPAFVKDGRLVRKGLASV